MSTNIRRTHAVRDRKVEPRLPHERDESSDEQRNESPANPPLGRQAHDDVQGGQVDTDRGPLTDHLYNEQVAPDAHRRRAR